MLMILMILFVMAPAFAVWAQRRADKQGERLAEEARAELAAGRPVREAPRERRLALWPYAILAIALSTLWALSNVSAPTPQGEHAVGPITLGVTSAALVWIAFHIFIFVKRTSTGVSLLLLAVMIASAAGLSYQTQFIPALAAFAERLH